MPSIFEVIKRMAAGKPIYDPNDAQQNEGYQAQPLDGQPPLAPQDLQNQTPQAATSPIRNHDESTFPVVEVQHVTTHVNGNTMQVLCRLCNRSSMQVILDRFHLLGGQIRMTDDLRPGESREYAVYRGPVLQNREDNLAVLRYRTRDGQYCFEATYDVEFQFDTNNKYYTVDEMRLHPPIRGIYS